MDVAVLRDWVIVIYGGMGILISIIIAIIAIVFSIKTYGILEDVEVIVEKAKIITSYVTKEIVEPLIDLAVLVQNLHAMVHKARNMFPGKGRKSNG